jgi:hypothetical protein
MEIKEVIDELNKLETTTSSLTLNVGRIMYGYLKTIDAKKQRKVVSEIKKADELKLNHQLVYDCYRMISKFPDMADKEFKLLPNLSITHYFEISRYKLDNGVAYLILQESSDLNESVAKMKIRARAAKEELIEPSDIERKEVLTEIYKKLKLRTLPELKEILTKLNKEYPEPILL